MKKVVLKKQPSEIITLDDIQWGEKCYGTSHNGEKGWIQPVEFESSNVRFLCCENGIITGDSFPKFNGHFLDGMKNWLSYGCEIYEFDNEKELFRWLSE